MDYISTRDSKVAAAKFTDILLTGLAPDGGLYLPAVYPRITPELLDAWRTLLDAQGYAALAAEVVKLFVDDIPLYADRGDHRARLPHPGVFHRGDRPGNKTR